MLHLVGKGSDTTGSSGASMDLVARIEPNAADGLSQLVGRSEVTMSGKAAAFGGRMMGTVADQILKQFAGNLAAQVRARAASAESQLRAGIQAAAPATPAAARTSAPTPAAEANSAGAASESQPQPPTLRPAGAPIAAPPEPALQPAAVPIATPATELNALALLWAIIRDWFRGLFRRRPA
jgi:hypothetical protein